MLGLPQVAVNRTCPRRSEGEETESTAERPPRLTPWCWGLTLPPASILERARHPVATTRGGRGPTTNMVSYEEAAR
jgi:hypothetical protein